MVILEIAYGFLVPLAVAALGFRIDNEAKAFQFIVVALVAWYIGLLVLS